MKAIEFGARFKIRKPYTITIDERIMEELWERKL
jgi:hypothetical protein